MKTGARAPEERGGLASHREPGTRIQCAGFQPTSPITKVMGIGGTRVPGTLTHPSKASFLQQLSTEPHLCRDLSDSTPFHLPGITQDTDPSGLPLSHQS